MENIKSFNDMFQIVKQSGKTLRIAAVNPIDEATNESLRIVEEQSLAEVVRIQDTLPERAAEKAVALIRRGDADVLMKGLISTDILLRAVLNKVSGLLAEGRVLTHISVAEIPAYHKLLFFTDVAVIPYPCAEHGGRQFPFVDGYQEIKQEAEGGTFGRCIVDGPLDLKSACSLQALQAKGIISPLEGDSDVLVMPDIEAGNAFYKAMTLFANARTAGILYGAKCPVVVPSRGDNPDAKFNSILFALATTKKHYNY